LHGHRLGVSIGHNLRAPDIQELLALGPHLSTRSYDIGLLIRPEPDGFKVPQAEAFNNLELTWQWQSPWGEQQLNVFNYQAEEFIHQRNLGLFYDLAERLLRNNCVRLEECLPVYEYTQADARFSGGEWQWSLPSLSNETGTWQLSLLADRVRGVLADGSALPRMPPHRLSLQLTWQHGDWQADLHGTRLGSQRRPGEFETPSRKGQHLDASLRYRFAVPGYELTAFVQGKNLTDQSLRNATSFMRNFTPEAGRQLELGLRWDR
jgi:iron complex outermembrane receptor protein